jgi:AcrR family transcriptional regulator
MGVEIADAVWKAGKTLQKEGEAREKNAARAARAERARSLPPKEMHLTKAVPLVLPEAVKKGTDGGRLPIENRSLFYVVREAIQAYTRKNLDANYFGQTLLPKYQEDHGPIPRLYYQARGVLYEPHTGVAIELGTREVEEYEIPFWRYDKILFIEKRGLWPVLESTKLAERFDLAVIASEGYSSTACRKLLDHADKSRQYRIFVFHDADPHGYNIARTLGEATRRMPEHSIETIDCGLRYEEGLELGLATEEFNPKNKMPKELVPLLNAVELEAFSGRQTRNGKVATRIELNAFTPPDLIAFIERKLEEHGAETKLVPPKEVLAEEARSLGEVAVSRMVADELARLARTEGLVLELSAQIFTDDVLGRLDPEEIRKTLMSNRERAWDGVIDEQARKLAAAKAEQVKDAVRKAIGAARN